MDIWKFNKGEWTEAYVFLKVLGEGRIYGANSNLHKDPLTYMDIVNIIREEPDRYLCFERMIKNEMAYIEASDHDVVFKIVTADELKSKAKELYRNIMNLKGDGAGAIPEAQSYLSGLRIASPKARLSAEASKKYGVKTDIIITSQSSIDHARNTQGFSVKSHLGNPATLFNSSPTSGFLFKVKGCDYGGMQELNAQSHSFDTMLKLIKSKYELEYIGCRNEIFADNLTLVDSNMDKVMQAAILVAHGFYGDCPSQKLTDICDCLIGINPLQHRRPEIFYPAKFKAFLYDAFAGMTASKEWNGRKLLSGGYLDVASDGTILYYRAVSDDVFCSYLFKKTFFDLPDRGVNHSIAEITGKAYVEDRKPTKEELDRATLTKKGKTRQKKGDWGYVFEKGGQYFFSINFQIRFK